LRGDRSPAVADIIAAGIQLRADAGDLQTLAIVASLLNRGDVRIVAVSPSPIEPRQEYVELRNIGAAPRDLSDFTLVRPTFGGFLPSSGFRFKGMLSPGDVCRVYTWSAHQSDACAGAWRDPILLNLWPRSGAWIVLREQVSGQPEHEIDRWYYRVTEQG